MMSDEADSSLGEKLLQGVKNLWSEVNSQGKVLNHHGQEIDALRSRHKVTTPPQKIIMCDFNGLNFQVRSVIL